MSKLLLEDIRHAYEGVPAVDGLTLNVEPGEIVCLLGPSGCGKTTTLRIAAGLERLQSGRVSIGGRVVADSRTSLPPEQRGIGMVFQDYALFPHLNVLENIAFGLREGSPEQRRATAHALLERVDLAAYGEQYPHALSGGEQQRVALARALAPRPGLMLLDEPFANLDVRLRDRIRDDTLAILKESGAGSLLVTHDPEEAMRMADRIAVMRKGRIVQVGSPGELYHHPANAFMVRFFNEVNDVRGVVRDGKVETPLGTVAAPKLAEAASVEVLVRPEGVRINGRANAAETIAATVRDARLIGPYSLAYLKLADGSEIFARLHDDPPPAGESVAVALDPAHVFVFPIAP